MRYNLFIGRYQSPHKGHMQIFNSFLKEEKPILIAIRDIEPDPDNPLTAAEVKDLWETGISKQPACKSYHHPGYSICKLRQGRGV
jgi:nicotinamide mononucleotide adenylyltransferase